ncbi:MAG: hypothetical protein U0R17_06990 [Acidimicrobiia bacterium]
MIDARTRFFAIATVVVFALTYVAPDEDLRRVPIFIGCIYIGLTLLCLADSISRNWKKNTK